MEAEVTDNLYYLIKLIVMKKLIILSVAFFVVSAKNVNAQNEVDALRYSQLGFLGGTARSAGMAGAFGALGGDFSTLSTNPGGIGIYRKSEITFTPSFFNQSTSSNLDGTSLQNSKPDFNFGNIGMVASRYNADKSGWKGFSFGFGYNRTNDFNNSIDMKGNNNNGSMLDAYLYDAVYNNGINNDLFGTQLAWNSYLLDSVGGKLVHALPNYGETQTKYVQSSGSMGEIVFSFGGNYNDKLYLGGTIGVPQIHYTESSQYTETLNGDTSVYGFKSLSLNQNLTTTGSGVNFKFGMIYKPITWLRIGAAFHSPSYYTMHDDYSSSITSNFTYPNSVHAPSDTTAYSPPGHYDYSLMTPGRVIGSLGFVLKDIGMIDIDYEYINYASAHLSSSTPGDFQSANQTINNEYTSTGNLRIGSEWKIVHPLSIRLGYAYYGSPYKSGGNDGSRMSYTAGLGFREGNFFMDLAYVFTQTKTNYYFYDPTIAYVDPSINTSKVSSLMMTIGYKFSSARQSRPRRENRPPPPPPSNPNQGYNYWH